MQSRLAIAAAIHRRLLPSGGPKPLSVQRLGCSTTSGRTADPAVHAVDPDEVSPTDAIHDEKLRHSRYDQESSTKDRGDDAYVLPKSPVQSSPKIESSGVGARTDPITQQKRRISAKIDDLSCAAIDQSPWPSDGKETDLKEQREDQQGDNVEYFKHRKASPLSEIEIADTRKPMSRATNGSAAQNDTVTGGNYYEGGRGYSVWRPEQVDTAEESLRRATEMFRSNAIRGDPDSPQGRVLRELCGENW